MPLGKRKYKKMVPGAYIGGRRYVRRRVVKGRRMPASARKYGFRIPTHRFHRWVTALDSGSGTSFVNVTDCTYDGTDSFITCTAAKKSCAFSVAFQLRDLPNLTDFTALFDSYMITGVMLQIKMIDNPDAYHVANTDPLVTSKVNFYPTLWYVPDHDDNNNVTLAQIKEFDRVRHKVLYPNRETNIMLRPTTLAQVYRSSITTGYAENKKRQWLDMANTDIPHYGLKCIFDFEGLSPASTFRFKVNVKYFFSCKNVR